MRHKIVLSQEDLDKWASDVRKTIKSFKPILPANFPFYLSWMFTFAQDGGKVLFYELYLISDFERILAVMKSFKE